MQGELHVLFIDTSDAATQPLVEELRRAGYDLTSARVDTPEAFAAALDASRWDVILADGATPHLTSLAVLHILKDKGLDIPYIVVSSAPDLDAAVEVMRAGAHDYFCREQLHRLAPAVQREVEAARQRRRHPHVPYEAEHNLLQAVIETLPDQIYVKDLQHRFVLVNTAMARLHGFDSVDAILGKTDTDLFGPLGAPDMEAEERLFATGSPILNQERFTPPQWGGPRWSLVTKIPLRDDKGEVIGLVGINRDITTLKQVEATLAQERTLLRTLIDHLTHYIFIKDAQDRFVDANLATAHLLGVKSPSELIGKTDFDFFPQELAQQYYQDDMRIIRDGQAVIDLEEITLDEQGEAIWVSVTKLPLYDTLGQIVGLVGMGVNISERKQSESQRVRLELEQARAKALRRFLGDASHDLRTPLSVMKTNLYLLRKQLDSERLLRHVDTLSLHTDRIHRLLEDMFTLSSLDLGTTEFQFERVDLNMLVQEAYARFQSAAAQKNQQMQLVLAAALPEVMGEIQHLKRAVNCVLENALHYTPDGGLITLHTERQARHALIEIRDSGIGITPDDLPHIFDRFYRTDKARGTDTGGSGLGLPIAKKIVEAHGGHIEVESTPGVGSTFRVLLPLPPSQYHEGA